MFEGISLALHIYASMANLIAAESSWQEHGNPATLQVSNVVYMVHGHISMYNYIGLCMYVDDCTVKMHKSANVHLLLSLKLFYVHFCCFIFYTFR